MQADVIGAFVVRSERSSGTVRMLWEIQAAELWGGSSRDNGGWSQGRNDAANPRWCSAYDRSSRLLAGACITRRAGAVEVRCGAGRGRSSFEQSWRGRGNADLVGKGAPDEPVWTGEARGDSWAESPCIQTTPEVCHVLVAPL